MTTERADRVIAHANAVFERLDRRESGARSVAPRRRAPSGGELTRRAARIGIAIGLISVLTIVIGLIVPIGMFGFLAAVGLAIGIATLFAFLPTESATLKAPAADLPNGPMVQRFDSYLYRCRPALPAPAQAELDRISAALPPLRQTLERIDALDPNAQDARRLMSKHLPGLIDRYLNVPTAYRADADAEGVTVDERLVEALAAGRVALTEIGESLARNDMMAFETQGRFIQSRYGEEKIGD